MTAATAKRFTHFADRFDGRGKCRDTDHMGSALRWHSEAVRDHDNLRSRAVASRPQYIHAGYPFRRHRRRTGAEAVSAPDEDFDALVTRIQDAIACGNLFNITIGDINALIDRAAQQPAPLHRKSRTVDEAIRRAEAAHPHRPGMSTPEVHEMMRARYQHMVDDIGELPTLNDGD